MTLNDEIMEAMHTVARVLGPDIVAIAEGQCGNLALGPHRVAANENGKGEVVMIDWTNVQGLPRCDVICVDLDECPALPELIVKLKQNGYLWTKGQLPSGPDFVQHSQYGDYHLYVKQTFND